MPKAKITKSSVDAMKPAAARFVVWDTDMKGFGVRVSTEGRKTYVVQYRLGGRGSPSQQVKLAVHGQITAEQARKLAQKALGEIAAGVDVAAVKRRSRSEQRDAPTVEECSTEFMEIHVRQKLKPTSARNYGLLFDTIIIPKSASGWSKTSRSAMSRSCITSAGIRSIKRTGPSPSCLR